jgi:ribosomal protein S18 acetylase RimI-like enzyme
MSGPRLRAATPADHDALAELWTACGIALRREHLREELAGVLARDPDLLLVLEHAGALVAAVMGTFDGRRGWVNRLAVRPDHQGRGLGRRLLNEVEDRLRAKGCRKVNLLVEPDNAAVAGFYERLGYCHDPLIFMERWL